MPGDNKQDDSNSQPRPEEGFVLGPLDRPLPGGGMRLKFAVDRLLQREYRDPITKK